MEIVGDNQDVNYITFPETYEGIIQSQVYHYRGRVDDVLDYWIKDYKRFRINS